MNKNDFTTVVLQQGDVILESCELIPKTAQKLPNSARGIVLAEGKATGHAHVLSVNAGTLFEEPESKERFLLIDGGKSDNKDGTFALLHEEHNTVNIPPGKWKMRIVQEYDHFKEETRNVTD